MFARKFYDLEIWKDANKLAIEIYKITKKFPADERYSTTDQIRRAATSVSANIAEGFGRYHFKDKTKFFYNSRGSILEVQNFIFFFQEIGYLDKNIARDIFGKYEKLIIKVNSFIASIKKQKTD
jgi:four helix bundle protein